jgi:KDO2-lipid IV(A) lauroyltransferase
VPATLAGVRQMIRALRRGECVGLLPDQVPPDGMGVWAPFFGRRAYTMTLAARLVQQTGAAAAA